MRCRYERPNTAITPNTSARCTGIEVTVDSPNKEDMLLTDWFVSNRLMSGKIVVCNMEVLTDNKDGSNRIKEEEMRVIAEFENAACFYLKETYNVQENRLLTLHFDAETVTSNEVSFVNL